MSKNIKEIGKELLGKSLNSFHRKTGITQLEENNKMQDGILNGILSQVDDAYLEKTEQSNVIHLEGSGDGVVVLDSIEGNTLVNIVKSYDSSNFSYSYSQKLDNNYFKLQHSANENSSNVRVKYGNHMYKPNTTYTLIVDIKENTSNAKLGVSGINSVISKFSSVSFANLVGQSMITFVTKDDFSTDLRGENPPTLDLYFCSWDKGGDLSKHITFRYWILEGDWTNKDLPPYFEGLQSSFEEKVNDESKYEIEILLNNKNLIDNSKSYQSSYASWIPNIGSLNNVVKTDTYNATFNNRGVGFLVKDLKPNTQYTLSIPSLLTNNKLGYALYDNENSINNWNYHIQGQGNISTNKITFTTPNRKTVAVVGVYGSYDVLYNNGASDGTVTIGNYRKLQLEVGNKNTEFNLQKQNKIKLLLNEPLRGTTAIKDKLVIKDSKLMIERNYREIIFNGTQRLTKSNNGDNTYMFAYMCQELKLRPNNTTYHAISDKLPYLSGNEDVPHIRANGSKPYGNVVIYINKSDIDNTTTNEYFKNNPIKAIFNTLEPYYEEVTNEYGEPIILEGYENGTIYIDSTIVPTTTVKYTPKMESLNTLKEVYNNNVMLTSDVNDNIIPYMMDVDLMIMEKEMALMSHKNIRKMEVLDMTSMQKRTQEMLERLIKGKSLTEQECKTRVTTYLNAGKITDEQAEELMLLIDEVYA